MPANTGVVLNPRLTICVPGEIELSVYRYPYRQAIAGFCVIRTMRALKSLTTHLTQPGILYAHETSRLQ